MSNINSHIKNILKAAHWCDNNNFPHLAYCFDGIVTDALPLSSNKQLASLNNCDIVLKTSSSSTHLSKSGHTDLRAAKSIDPKLLYAVGRAVEGGIPSMRRVAILGQETIGGGVNTISDISGLIPGVGKYLRGLGNFVGNEMQGKGFGQSALAGAEGFGMGALPPMVQVGIKGIQVLINYLQTLDLSKIPWLQTVLENLTKWLPLISSGIGYALWTGMLKPKSETKQLDLKQNSTTSDEPQTNPSNLYNKSTDLPLAAMPIIDKMIKISGKKENYSWVIFELLNKHNIPYAYGVLPKDLYLVAATV